MAHTTLNYMKYNSQNISLLHVAFSQQQNQGVLTGTAMN